MRIFKRCNDCGKRLIWKKDRKYGSYKLTLRDKNGKYREKIVYYCQKCGKKMATLQMKVMAQTLGKKPSNLNMTKMLKNLRREAR